MAGRVQGKRVIVTGGGSGIGRAAAVRLAQEGAKVGVIDIDKQAADATVSRIVADGGDAVALQVDVTVEEEIAAAVSSIAKRWNGLDIVIANAAVQLFGEDDRADRLALAVWEKTLRINLTGIFLTCKHGIRSLLASGGGSVVCTASPTGLFGLAPGFDAYSASKAGVYGLVRVMANDYAAEGIRVNAVIPGFTATPLVRTIVDDDEQRKALLRAVPLGRPGTAEEVAAAILFLASDEASYATGSALAVDGGITCI